MALLLPPQDSDPPGVSRIHSMTGGDLSTRARLPRGGLIIAHLEPSISPRGVPATGMWLHPSPGSLKSQGPFRARCPPFPRPGPGHEVPMAPTPAYPYHLPN
ncbi:uncharacterized protein BO80DRAFT_261679 [Aspergillus ibericus CBS 121593]|uniref:Uncharacterized protein n=1 Tax=Aspergillus ibericus CBS 121593 TaxID=1448316 RepID=A0A395GJ48_9EURO|nr:hypothetical protein BO80DRAFT_261679 [Aspergillus ibericus CBS 121593]RAK95505.1 hypothetical protein BO80DRAFT_261679 [Aspergillus ibericus CBS 121593]